MQYTCRLQSFSKSIVKLGGFQAEELTSVRISQLRSKLDFSSKAVIAFYVRTVELVEDREHLTSNQFYIIYLGSRGYHKDKE